MQKQLQFLFLLACTLFLSACNMEKDIEIELPPHNRQLVVECYLEPGKPYRLSVLESVGYFEAPQIPVVPDAKAFITHNGERIELIYKPIADRNFQKIYTHSSARIMDGKPGDVYTLEVWDSKGRRVTGTTTILNKVPIEKIEWRYNSKEEALLLTTFQDDPNTVNFYRYLVHRDSLERGTRRDIIATDEFRNGQTMAYGSGYNYEKGDTLVVTLYHIEKQYHDFLNSVFDARNSSENPFGQPSQVKSAVTGGIGVFTNLAYDRHTVIID